MAPKLTSIEKMKSLLTVTTSAATVFSGLCLYQGNEKFYEEVAMPLVRHVDPELAHSLAVKMLKYGFYSSKINKSEVDAALKTKVWDLSFSSPIGMAAGFDKQGEAVEGLHRLGFSFVEIGSVTPKPQPGNPRPRVFRLLADRAIVNRYGFNSDGHDVVRRRIQDLKRKGFQGIIGINLGKNKESDDPINDYVEGVKAFHEVADYFVINVSSPNTPGLRDLQSKENLTALLTKVNETRTALSRRPPLLLKLAPDLTDAQKQDIADVVRAAKTRIDGLIISNTTVERNNLLDRNKMEQGGLSGAPLTRLSTEMISDMYKRTQGMVPIIGVGGIFSGQDAYEKIKAGASLIQIYTSYIYCGPPIVGKIKRELSSLVEKDGFSSITDAVGVNVRKK